MKKYIYFIVASLAVVACAKEANIDKPIDKNQDQTVHELFVSIADVIDPDTRASISESDGTFTWTTGDEIAVKTDADNVYKFTAQDGGSSVRFTYTGTMNGTPSEVKYPYTADFSDTALPTEITGLTGALDAGSIRLSGTVSGNSVEMEHTNALLKVKFNNIPTFASKIKIYEGSTERTVSFTKLSARGDIAAYIPVSAGSINLIAELLDDNDNVIIKKSKDGVSFTAGSLKKMAALTVGYIITMTDENAISDAQINIWDGSNSGVFLTGYDYPYKLNSYPGYSGTGNKYYVVLNTVDLTWASEGAGIGVQFSDKNWNNSTQTDAVYLYRDLDFTSPYGNAGMKTNYRTYFYLRASNCQTYWEDTTMIGVKAEGDSSYSWSQMTQYSAYLFYYENSNDYYGKSMSYAINNGKGWIAKDESDPWVYPLNCEYIYNCDL